jgi:hypothetical protein
LPTAAHPDHDPETPAPVTAEIAAELAGEGSLVSPLATAGGEPAPLGELVAAGPATREDPRAYAAVVELVREGYLLHYGEPRIVLGADPDLALLAGDYLYARGLDRLAALGDQAAVAELSDLISTVAELHARPEPGDAPAAAWLAAAVSIATGDYEARSDAPAAAADPAGDARALYAAAHRKADRAGLGERLTGAAEAVGFAISDRG